MDATRTSLHLLSHFERDGAVDAAEIEMFPRVQPTRGIGWVLKWAAAAAVLFYATTVLTEFAYSLAAEQLLVRAARAAVLEATLPRATVQSVEQSVYRRLGDTVASQGRVKLALLQNGVWVSKKHQPRGGDRLSITVTIPAQALMPNWLRRLTLWRGSAIVRARAERIMPGRQLPQ
jgi:hypothetical protein